MTDVNTPAMPQEAQDHIKNLMFDGFYSHFNSMMNTIRKLPLAPHMLQIIVKEFDNGLLWTKEAFAGMVIPSAPHPSPAAPDLKVLGVQDAGAGNDAPLTPVDNIQAA